MKAIIAAAALAVVGTQAAAIDLGAGLSLTTTATAEYNIDVENMTATLEPVIGYAAPAEVMLSVGTELSIYDGAFVDATFETLPTLDFRAEKTIMPNASIYGEVSYDLEAEERTDAIVGVSFSF